MHVMRKAGCSLAYYSDVSTYYQFIIYFPNLQCHDPRLPHLPHYDRSHGIDNPGRPCCQPALLIAWPLWTALYLGKFGIVHRTIMLKSNVFFYQTFVYLEGKEVLTQEAKSSGFHDVIVNCINNISQTIPWYTHRRVNVCECLSIT